jgi:2-methylcitrate dehydratase PrpD
MTSDGAPDLGARLAGFVSSARPPERARRRAAAAVLDTVGVTLAGAAESAARIVQKIVSIEGGHVSPKPRAKRAFGEGGCSVLGAGMRASASGAALANGTAAHALDYDDMCFVSLAHPSAPLVSAMLAAAERAGSTGLALLDAYVVGFEVEARLGRLMNPRHYRRGWHCTSTLGTIGAAAAVSRLLALDAVRTQHALAIAASSAVGLKENFGTMTKPLHAGMAARNGLEAALFAQGGLTASAMAFEGPQGFLAAMDSERTDVDSEIADLGRRWEIVDTGITVKLYPSCAATHPPLDALLDLRRSEGFSGDDVAHVDIDVDAVTPTVLIYDRPATGLEAKFSLPYCAAAAVIDGRVGIDSFDDARLGDPALRDAMNRITMRADPQLEGQGPPLTQARVTVTLRDGRAFSRSANGARGYPENPASDAELDDKFMACARRTLPEASARDALQQLRAIEQLSGVRSLLVACSQRAHHEE